MEKYQNISKHIECPVCKHTEGRLLWFVDSQQAAQHYVLKEQHPERFSKLVSQIEKLWDQDTCEVVQCDKCDFCFSHPFIAGDAQFYSLAYERSGYPEWKWEFQLTYNALLKTISPKHTLLEIGAGDGAFVKRIASDFLSKDKIICTEFSEYGIQQIEKAGIKCIASDIRDLPEEKYNNHFQTICMFQVLEHLDDLDVLFQKINGLLKDGGNLFIGVPNPSAIEFNELHGALLDMPPNHVGRWNKKCFEAIGRRNGFHVKDHAIEQFRFTPMAKKFLLYRVLKRAQKSGSLENRLLRIKRKKLQGLLLVAGSVLNLPRAIPAILKMNARIGGSYQWAHLLKTDHLEMGQGASNGPGDRT